MVYLSSFFVREEKMWIASTKKGVCYLGNDTLQEIYRYFDSKTVATGIEADDFNTPYILDLKAFYNGHVHELNWPLDLKGTSFQKEVWYALKTIPYGQTVSYSDVATQINRPTATRAVGSAIGRNPVLIVIPCHRVIGKNGKLTGFRSGLKMKEELLKLEQMIMKIKE